MSGEQRSWQDDAEAHPAREYLTYILSGLITLGLVGWIVGLISHHVWFAYVGAGIGVLIGIYLAWRHHVDRQRSAGDRP